jgi:hypothetical protein
VRLCGVAELLRWAAHHQEVDAGSMTASLEAREA